MLTTDPRYGVVRAMPAWHRPSNGDDLYGLDAIAAWLAIPHRLAVTLVGRGLLPVRMEGRSHMSRRTVLARHILRLEAEAGIGGVVAAAPVTLHTDDAMGLCVGDSCIAVHLACTVSGVRHRRNRLGMPVFRLGNATCARRASLDHWKVAQEGETQAARRHRTVMQDRRDRAGPDELVGAAAIADYLGRTVRATQQAIYERRLPVSRRGGAVIGDREALKRFARREEKENVHGERC